jgi:hypothetical protein
VSCFCLFCRHPERSEGSLYFAFAFAFASAVAVVFAVAFVRRQNLIGRRKGTPSGVPKKRNAECATALPRLVFLLFAYSAHTCTHRLVLDHEISSQRHPKRNPQKILSSPKST